MKTTGNHGHTMLLRFELQLSRKPTGLIGHDWATYCILNYIATSDGQAQLVTSKFLNHRFFWFKFTNSVGCLVLSQRFLWLLWNRSGPLFAKHRHGVLVQMFLNQHSHPGLGKLTVWRFYCVLLLVHRLSVVNPMPKSSNDLNQPWLDVISHNTALITGNH